MVSQPLCPVCPQIWIYPIIKAVTQVETSHFKNYICASGSIVFSDMRARVAAESSERYDLDVYSFVIVQLPHFW